jgi:hypothetical protein
VLVIAIVGAGFALSRSGDKDQTAAGRITGAPEIFLEPVADAGPDPFSGSVDTAPSTATSSTAAPTTTTKTAGSSSTTAKAAEATAVQGVTGSKPGLYGGTRSNSSCDRAQLVSFLQANPAKAAAWAGVQGIQPAEIPAFIQKLTPVRLKADTRVTNHGFKNGAATPRQSVLQAGTSVLVDDRGEPRVRCACGNPLRLPVAAQSAPAYVGTAWPGFAPEKTSVVAPAPTPVQAFTLTDPVSGQAFNRPVGTEGAADTTAAPLPSSTTTTAAPTATTAGSVTTTTSARRPPGSVVDVASEGVVRASSIYPGNEYPADLSVDGDATTSWFSAGPGKDGSTTYTWTGTRDDFIATLTILNNELHERPDFRTGFGFGHVRIEVFAAGKADALPVFRQDFDLPGSPDPNITVDPNVRGGIVVLTFTGSEDPGCGGFSELQVGAIR